MTEKNIQILLNDEIGIIIALLKTVDMAVGNAEYFGKDGQSIAITLDIVSGKLEACRKRLISLDEDKKNM